MGIGDSELDSFSLYFYVEDLLSRRDFIYFKGLDFFGLFITFNFRSIDKFVFNDSFNEFLDFVIRVETIVSFLFYFSVTVCIDCFYKYVVKFIFFF